jgi:hypothetical protein
MGSNLTAEKSVGIAARMTYEITSRPVKFQADTAVAGKIQGILSIKYTRCFKTWFVQLDICCILYTMLLVHLGVL